MTPLTGKGASDASPITLEPIALDEGAHVYVNDECALAEVCLYRASDGRYLLQAEDDEGSKLEVALRPDFLDEFIAQARAREADAA